MTKMVIGRYVALPELQAEVVDDVRRCLRAALTDSVFVSVYSRPYWVVRSRLWYDVLSVYRLSSVVCNVVYCG